MDTKEDIKATKSACGCIIVIIVLVFGVSGIFFLFSGGEKAKPDEIEAYVMAQEFVKRQLKAPATADFPSAIGQGVTITTVNDTTFLISAYVDAQNTFGATLRMQFDCMVVYVGNDNWQCLNLNLEE